MGRQEKSLFSFFSWIKKNTHKGFVPKGTEAAGSPSWRLGERLLFFFYLVAFLESAVALGQTKIKIEAGPPRTSAPDKFTARFGRARGCLITVYTAWQSAAHFREPVASTTDVPSDQTLVFFFIV